MIGEYALRLNQAVVCSADPGSTAAGPSAEEADTTHNRVRQIGEHRVGWIDLGEVWLDRAGIDPRHNRGVIGQREGERVRRSAAVGAGVAERDFGFIIGRDDLKRRLARARPRWELDHSWVIRAPAVTSAQWRGDARQRRRIRAGVRHRGTNCNRSGGDGDYWSRQRGTLACSFRLV